MLAEQQTKSTEKYNGTMKQQSTNPAEVVRTQRNHVASSDSRAPCVGEAHTRNITAAVHKDI